jgi:hypothetical protein
LEKPLTRVYSWPKPTQPDNSTNGELNLSPQNSIDKGALLCVIGRVFDLKRKRKKSAPLIF